MPGPSLIQRQVDALKDLARQSVERATRETKTDAEFAKDKATAERQYQSARQGIVRRRDLQLEAIESEIGTKRTALDQAYQASVAGAKTDRDQKVAHAKKRHQVESEAADTALEEAGWETGAVYDANIDKVNKKTEQFKARLNESLAHSTRSRKPPRFMSTPTRNTSSSTRIAPRPRLARPKGRSASSTRRPTGSSRTTKPPRSWAS